MDWGNAKCLQRPKRVQGACQHVSRRTTRLARQRGVRGSRLVSSTFNATLTLRISWHTFSKMPIGPRMTAPAKPSVTTQAAKSSPSYKRIQRKRPVNTSKKTLIICARWWHIARGILRKRRRRRKTQTVRVIRV